MSVNVISSFANPAIRAVRALAERRGREETGQFFLEGARDIAVALAAGWQAETFIATPGFVPDTALRQAMALTGARLLTVTTALAARLSGRDNPQALLAVLRQRWAVLADVAAGLWVGLEEIRDPGNLGTIIRTAAASGAGGVLLIGPCCDPYAPEAIRASVGTFAHLKFARATGEEFLHWRQTYAGQVVATQAAGVFDYREMQWPADLLLLLGGESRGLSAPLLEAATVRVRIPMRPAVESLNVATAAALLLYESQRGKM